MNRMRAAIVGIYLLALSTCACAQGQEYRSAGFSFRYPSNWKVAGEQKDFTFQIDPRRDPYSLVRLEAADGTNAAILIWYRKFPAPVNCGGVHNWLKDLYSQEQPSVNGSPLDQDDVTEHFDVGTVYTVRTRRLREHPDHETLASTLCMTSGEAAYVVFGYPHNYPQRARDLVMRTFAFTGTQTLFGDWHGQGYAVLTLNKNGTAVLSFPSLASDYGTYRITGDGHVIFSWTVLKGMRTAVRRDCGYTLGGGTLTLRCDDSSTLAFHR